MGVRVSFPGGQFKVTDGPFPEAKEVIGGYWMIEVTSKAEAIEWASRCPGSENEVIEVRQGNVRLACRRAESSTRFFWLCVAALRAQQKSTMADTIACASRP